MSKKTFASSLMAFLIMMLFVPTSIAGINNISESDIISTNHSNWCIYNAHMCGRVFSHSSRLSIFGRLTPQQRIHEKQDVQQRMEQQMPQKFRSEYEQMMERQSVIERKNQIQYTYQNK